MANKIYRMGKIGERNFYFELIDIDIATGNAKGRDLETGKIVTVVYKNIGGYVYLTEQEIEKRFPKYAKKIA